MIKIHFSFSHIRRLEEISVNLIRFGFGEWMDRIRFGRIIRRLSSQASRRAQSRASSHGKQDDPGSPDLEQGSAQFDWRCVDDQQTLRKKSHWQRIRMLLEALGPTFVKFGQILSNRADLIEPGLIEELSKLQDQVTPFSADLVETIIRDELLKDPKELFSSFSPQPVASASIAQVHEAWLLDGRRVAVKVQRPDIQTMIMRDLEILELLARLVERYVPEYRHFDPSGLIAEFRKQILRELDFTLELHNMERFSLLFRGNQNIYVPGAFKPLCSHKILTMEFVQGVKLSAILDGTVNGFDREAIAKNLAELMLEQVFFHGFFHADPHPGNVIMLGGGRACFIDFGMMGRIHPDEQRILVELLVAMAGGNYKHITTSLLRLVGHTSHDIPSLEVEIADLLDLYFDRPMGEIDFGEVFQRLVLLIQGHELKVPSKFLLMAKALVIAEGVGSQLSPSFSLMTLFEPFAARMSLRQLRPDRLWKTISTQAESYLELLRDFPIESMELLKAARRGDFTINFRIKGIEPLRQSLENIGTRLIFGIVLAAILISSSLIIRAEVPPIVNGVPVIGLIGFGIAGLMSFGFLITILARLWRKPKKGD